MRSALDGVDGLSFEWSGVVISFTGFELPRSALRSVVYMYCFLHLIIHIVLFLCRLLQSHP
jgi:hypothetical protein